jgi:succinate dehydrogenase / fumarate reductase cytochrome b subunit
MIIIGIHLNHGFQSAFQTLGLSHKKYTPLIKSIGKAYAFIVPFGFAIIPIIVYGRENLWW